MKIETLKLSYLIEAIRKAAASRNYNGLNDILEALDKPEWYTHELILRTKENRLITPTKIDGEWNFLE